MKKIYLFTIILAVALSSKAQDFNSLLEGGAADANKFLESYLEPAFVGFGYGMNSGWYNTGKPHKMLGFDLTITANLAAVPTSAQFFTPNPGDYTNTGFAPSESGETQFPTLFGPNLDADDIPYLVFTDDDGTEFRISGPTGLGMEEAIGMNSVPSPMVQVGIGLIKNTELKLRLIPEQTFGDPGQEVSTKMFGLGVMHDVKQWIPGLSKLPFDLSGFFAFNRFSVNANINEDEPDQQAELTVGGTTFQGIISKKLSVLTVYGGLGFLSTKSSLKLKGTYDEIPGVTDPIDFQYNVGGLRANVGARLKLLIFTFHAEYALQKYNTFTAGFGISIR